MTSTPHTTPVNSAYTLAHELLQDRHALRLALAGAASGLVSAVLVTPLDVVKIRLQNQFFSPDVVPKYQGTFPTLAKIWTEEGFRGLFSGLAPSVYAYLPNQMIWFSVYHMSKDALAKELKTGPDGSTTTHFLATLTASTVCTVAVSPLWVVRTRLMAQSTAPGEPHPFHYTSTGNAFSTIFKIEGWRAFYKGLGPSLLGVSHSLIMFPLYERLKHEMKVQGYGTNPDGTLTNLLSYCLITLQMRRKSGHISHEVIRTRLQTQKTHVLKNKTRMVDGKLESYTKLKSVAPKYRGVIQTASVLVREEGLLVCACGAISLWIYELVLKL
ncbi:mitochondrial carrier [Rhizoclosmatium globosum]|uniref:Mitochondrial carrier n=1 Tax=Rhizoclosmatium globosum TaxID=329046 RepID=A0A1Y2BLZ6_9FUNG|nr:mitochondrial carrier [Rhizoclosmatium globosum]|eukprot:ORY35175.1 mitochondrial carrier [Rhizoclosmatium globosum]